MKRTKLRWKNKFWILRGIKYRDMEINRLLIFFVAFVAVFLRSQKRERFDIINHYYFVNEYADCGGGL